MPNYSQRSGSLNAESAPGSSVQAMHNFAVARDSRDGDVIYTAHATRNSGTKEKSGAPTDHNDSLGANMVAPGAPQHVH